MDDATVTQALGDAPAEVLETMFFTTAMDEPVEASNSEPPVRVRVRFQGTPSGMFSLQAAGAAARTIAADFLGQDASEFSTAQVWQVMCELANMICGATLSRLDVERQFDLSSPEITAAECPPPYAGICRSLYLPDGPLTLCMKLGRA
jgi:CheY-specific phosphatase CheX